MHRVTRRQFEKLVRAALDGLPSELQRELRNLQIVIEDEASDEDLVENEVPEDEDLFGIFEGVPLTERAYGEDMMLPNLIRIFQLPHEDAVNTLADLQAEVVRTVRHEVAHYFGIDDDRLEQLGAY